MIELFAFFLIFCLFAGMYTAYQNQSKPTGETCPLCQGKGYVRSGQWGGFPSTCIRCHGKGTV